MTLTVAWWTKKPEGAPVWCTVDVYMRALFWCPRNFQSAYIYICVFLAMFINTNACAQYSLWVIQHSLKQRSLSALVEKVIKFQTDIIKFLTVNSGSLSLFQWWEKVQPWTAATTKSIFRHGSVTFKARVGNCVEFLLLLLIWLAHTWSVSLYLSRNTLKSNICLQV